jgi:hypothetical protein
VGNDIVSLIISFIITTKCNRNSVDPTTQPAVKTLAKPAKKVASTAASPPEVGELMYETLST